MVRRLRLSRDDQAARLRQGVAEKAEVRRVAFEWVPHGEAETQAVDDEGEVLDLLVQRRRDKAAAQGASVFRLSQAGSVSKPPRPVMKRPQAIGNAPIGRGFES